MPDFTVMGMPETTVNKNYCLVFGKYNIRLGGGSIIAFDDGKISVDFSGTRKLFQFPSAFHSFLSTDDLELQGHVAILLQEEAEARLLEEARKREEKEQHQSGAKEKHSVVQPSPHMPQGIE